MTEENPVDRINELRSRFLSGEDITKEQAAEAVMLMRGQRAKSVTPSKEPTLPTNLADLFNK